MPFPKWTLDFSQIWSFPCNFIFTIYSPRTSDLKTCLPSTSHSISLQNSTNFVSEMSLAAMYPFHSCHLPLGFRSSLDLSWSPHLRLFLLPSILRTARLSFWKRSFLPTSFPAPKPSLASCQVSPKVPIPTNLSDPFPAGLAHSSSHSALFVVQKTRSTLPDHLAASGMPFHLPTCPRAPSNATSSMRPFYNLWTPIAHHPIPPGIWVPCVHVFLPLQG